MEKDLKVALLIGLTVLSVVAVVFYERDSIPRQDRLRSTVSGTTAGAMGQSDPESTASAYPSASVQTQHSSLTVRTPPRFAYPRQNNIVQGSGQWYRARGSPTAPRYQVPQQPIQRGAVLQTPQFRVPATNGSPNGYQGQPTAQGDLVPPYGQELMRSSGRAGSAYQPTLSRTSGAPTLSVPAVRVQRSTTPVHIRRISPGSSGPAWCARTVGDRQLLSSTMSRNIVPKPVPHVAKATAADEIGALSNSASGMHD